MTFVSLKEKEETFRKLVLSEKYSGRKPLAGQAAQPQQQPASPMAVSDDEQPGTDEDEDPALVEQKEIKGNKDVYFWCELLPMALLFYIYIYIYIYVPPDLQCWV